MLVSVIMPIDRRGPEVTRAVEAVLGQTHRELELILVGTDLPHSEDSRVRRIVEPDRNPAARRNLAASSAKGELLAFIDDDAFAAPDWLALAVEIFEDDPSLAGLGGPDPAPVDSPFSELISDLLLSTRWIGSGIACHESRPRAFQLTAPHDIALVNLFVRRELFQQLGGFDRAIGYVGEDSELIGRLMAIGRVLYDPRPVVFHRRRPFPMAFLLQRWRYRTKTGRLLVGRKGSSYRRSPKVIGLLLAGLVFLTALLLAPPLALALLLAYALITAVLAGPRARSPLIWPLIPFVFLAHHAVYFAGIVTGVCQGLLTRKDF